MYKYTASQLINRARQLADLQNTNFLSWGEMFSYANQAYRKVYQDGITIGDLYYLKEADINGRGQFELPNDFYQLKSLTDYYGQDLDRGDDYEVINGTIRVNYDGFNKLEYYPTPETITAKAPRKEVSLPFVPISGYGDSVISNDAKIYNIKTSTYVKTNASAVGSYILGSYSYLNITTRTEYGYDGNQIRTYTNPVLCNGLFRESPYDGIGWANEDLTQVYSVTNGSLYFNGELIAENYTPGLNARTIFWNGQTALVDLNRITYPDGSWESTDSPSAIVLLKTDINTGYGYVCKTGNSYYLEGWTPETKIDYPNNVCFDLCAYEMAIQFRIKQNADITLLTNAYSSLSQVYNASLSQDGGSYPTIKNSRAFGWRFRW